MKRTPLKRTGFKRKPKAKKRKSSSPLKKAKDKAWDAFSLYIRTRDAIKTTGTTERCKCVTCGKELPTTGAGCIQAGHWLGGRRGLNLFEEMAVHGQCSGCNIFGAGKQSEYTAFMMLNYSHDVLEIIVRQANQPWKWTADALKEVEEKYTQMTKELHENHD